MFVGILIGALWNPTEIHKFSFDFYICNPEILQRHSFPLPNSTMGSPGMGFQGMSGPGGKEYENIHCCTNVANFFFFT